jgi:replicative DNA helicase
MSAVETTEVAPVKFEFDEEFQDKVIALALRDTSFLERVSGLLKPEYFTKDVNAHILNLVEHYYGAYRKAPDRAIHVTLVTDAVRAKRLRRDQAGDVLHAINAARKADISDRSFVVDKISDFARDRAVENAIMESVGLIEKRDFAKIKRLIEQAIIVGSEDDSDDFDYWEDIERRTQERIDEAAGIRVRDGITSGLADFDTYLYHHGWGRRELSVIMGAAKAGKSMSLGDFAKAASMAGKNVLYVTLEVSKKIISERVDASVSDTAITALKMSPRDVERKIKAHAASGKNGLFKIREYASGTFKCSHLRRLLESYRSKGIIFDAVFVDYADIMAPERFSGDLKEDSRLIYLDLRAIAFENNLAMITATQTNRTGAGKMTAGMTDVADDFNKIRTADIVLSINSTEAERSAGEARIYFAACRNSEDGFTLRIKQNRSKMRFMEKILGRETS